MNYNEERKFSENRKETTDEEPKITKSKDGKEKVKGTTKKEWEEKGAYVAIKIGMVQKHKVENKGPLKHPFNSCKEEAELEEIILLDREVTKKEADIYFDRC